MILKIAFLPNFCTSEKKRKRRTIPEVPFPKWCFGPTPALQFFVTASEDLQKKY